MFASLEGRGHANESWKVQKQHTVQESRRGGQPTLRPPSQRPQKERMPAVKTVGERLFHGPDVPY